jgi:hypothetical protein
VLYSAASSVDQSGCYPLHCTYCTVVSKRDAAWLPVCVICCNLRQVPQYAARMLSPRPSSVISPGR